jgi:hypothetical protein
MHRMLAYLSCCVCPIVVYAFAKHVVCCIADPSTHTHCPRMPDMQDPEYDPAAPGSVPDSPQSADRAYAYDVSDGADPTLARLAQRYADERYYRERCEDLERQLETSVPKVQLMQADDTVRVLLDRIRDLERTNGTLTLSNRYQNEELSQAYRRIADLETKLGHATGEIRHLWIWLNWTGCVNRPSCPCGFFDHGMENCPIQANRDYAASVRAPFFRS